MAYGWPEQKEDGRMPYVKRRSKGTSKYLKKSMNRKIRRWEKQDPEDAPTKHRYFGFEY